MGHKKQSRTVLEALLDFATENEATCIRALIKHDTYRAAAKALGKNNGAFQSAIRTVKRRAARRGFAPEHGWNPPSPRTKAANVAPEGFELERVSELVDADGERTAAWNKLRQARDLPAAPPPGFLVDRVSIGEDGQGNQFARWTAYSPEKAERWAAMVDAVKAAVEPLDGGCKPRRAPPRKSLEETLTVYGLGDPHVGMLAWEPETGASFDLKIADRITSETILRLIAAAPPSRIGGLALIGDNFHADDDRQVTPGHGHKLDVDGRSAKVWRVATRMWKNQIDRMLDKHAEVMVWIICGNHDPEKSFLLAEWLRAWYRNEPRVTIGDNIPEHQYYLFGEVLLGFTHGHRSKPEALQGVMAHDVPDMWAAAKAERHWFTGHVHNRSMIELRGCTVETLRTLAAPDAYAARSGYRSKRAAVAVTYHPQFGEIMRATVGVR